MQKEHTRGKSYNPRFTFVEYSDTSSIPTFVNKLKIQIAIAICECNLKNIEKYGQMSTNKPSIGSEFLR